MIERIDNGDGQYPLITNTDNSSGITSEEYLAMDGDVIGKYEPVHGRMITGQFLYLLDYAICDSE